MNVMILEKHSSLLGYQDETTKPLMANHHDVVKFSSPDDPNYKAVRNALRSIVKTFRCSRSDENESGKDIEIIQKWLGVTGLPEEDLISLRSVRKAGTCEHLLQKPKFEDWVNGDSPHILWAHAPPGSGKKRSLSNMLQSVAYQIAVENESFRQALVEVAKSGIHVDKADAMTVWRNIFVSKLSAIGSVLCLVIDGLDESESSGTFIDLVSNSSMSQSSIRVFIFSRPLSSINQAIQRARKRVTITDITLTDNLKDIRLVAADEMEDFLSNEGLEDFKHDIIEEITSRSQGNFLWASLILQMVVDCHRQEEVKQVLRATPDGMVKVYHGMSEAIAKIDRKENIRLCRILLSWAMYSIRPIRIEELMDLYPSEFHTIIDLKHTISEVCGQFVVINTRDQVVLPFSLDMCHVNEELLFQCLNFLCNLSLKIKVRQRKTPMFLSYASVSWAHHLNRSSVQSDRVLEILVQFFNGIPLPWIQSLAMNEHLSHLVAVSSHLMSFVRQRRKINAIKTPALLCSPELSLLETWANDLMKMTAKFGSHLIDDPDVIYKCIPSLSPENSMFYQKYSKISSATISISGISITNMNWDDCLARVSNGPDSALHIAVSAEYLAVANGRPNGRIQLQSGSLLACYCLDNTYVWRVKDRTVITKIESPRQERPKCLKFGLDESFLIIATDTRRVYRLNLDDNSSTWVGFDHSLLEETSIPEGAFVNSPSSADFNPDSTQIAVAYLNFPLAVWNLDPPEIISRCRQNGNQGQTVKTISWTGVNRVVWHPFNGQVLGINRLGDIFKWAPIDDSYKEVKRELDNWPSEIQCCRNGLSFATSDSKGSVRIYNYSQMVQIYKLTSDDIMTAIALSPDSRRLYDLRVSCYNVWQPDCLIGVDDTSIDSFDNNDSVTSSERTRIDCSASDLDEQCDSMFSSPTSEVHADTKPMITAVATCAKNKNIFAHATDDGTKSISRGRTRQILFDSKSERLLVCGTERLQVLRVADGSIAAEIEIDQADPPAQWDNHPTDPNILLSFTVGGVTALSWDALKFKYTVSHKLAPIASRHHL
ncbi:Eisosome protein 1 [Penicillium cf. griseofulvum]|uniref:Eisosome protein 1 n=1 Tax=Penicillium cf. griseofulvum TaxID=2972120 RepID=A0A9W9ITU3_9EURO|nr:Eisosome protein 1 [Penicillium cf. griseofulvum]KAJ5430488.1 Eisosome protein 1 [Penicillium cf. griseofulvum]